jgi:hypothetical protein
VLASDSLVKGVSYEKLFEFQCLDRKLIPEKPVTPLPWDYTITNPETLQSYRVQVKGTNTFQTDGVHPSGRYRIVAKAGRGSNCRKIPDYVDVLSCYVRPMDTFYNIPRSACPNISMWLYPHIKHSRGQYECWRHDWSIFDT